VIGRKYSRNPTMQLLIMSGFILMIIKTAGTLKFLKENRRIVFQGDILQWASFPCQLVHGNSKQLLTLETQ
jgi:hypothetical protein